MSPGQRSVDCPNPTCAAPAALALCTRFASGFGVRIGGAGLSPARWDDTHCLVCGHFSSPYSQTKQPGASLESDRDWLDAVDRALVLARSQHLSSFLAFHDMGVYDLLAMRHAVRGLRDLHEMSALAPTFPHVGLLRGSAGAPFPQVFGVAHGEAESEPFARKVRVLGRLLGANSAETSPRYCTGPEQGTAWYFYGESEFIGLLRLEHNRGYRGHVTIDGCLDRLLNAG
jgi:hypothetical protein